MDSLNFKQVPNFYFLSSSNHKISSLLSIVNSCIVIGQSIIKPKSTKMSKHEQMIYKMMKAATSKLPKLFVAIGGNGINKRSIELSEGPINKLNEDLSKNNSFLVIVRGKNDDKDIFDNESFNLSNIKAVKDFSVLETPYGNLLCVGGGVTTEREWLKKKMSLIKKFSPSAPDLFYDNEGTVFDAEKIQEAINGREILGVISPSAPSFVVNNFGLPEDCDIEKLEKVEKTIKSVFEEEHTNVDRIYELLRDTVGRAKYWLHNDRCCDDNVMTVSGTKFICSNENQANLYNFDNKNGISIQNEFEKYDDEEVDDYHELNGNTFDYGANNVFEAPNFEIGDELRNIFRHENNTRLNELHEETIARQREPRVLFRTNAPTFTYANTVTHA